MKKKNFWVKNALEVSRISFSAVLSISIVTLSYLAIKLTIYEEPAEEAVIDEALPITGEEDKYRVFVSSSRYDGDLGGLAGANEKCDNLADSGKWVAFLADSSGTAFSRISAHKYYLMDETTLVVDWSSGAKISDLSHPIDRDENGNYNLANIWTGYSNSAGEYNCEDWTSDYYDEDMDIDYGGIGENSTGSSYWYKLDHAACDGRRSLYCFEALKDSDEDGYLEDVDCDDKDAKTHPGASEVCDGKDNNCDGAISSNEQDSDGDGYMVCEGDCDDSNKNKYPGKDEVCNGQDDNCDGIVPSNEYDTDGDGYMICENDCNDSNTALYPGAVEVCDNYDNDCDGKVDENLSRICGTNTGICTIGQSKCVVGKWGNCSGVSPQNETCDGLDNDCDGQTDEGCSCNSGSTQSCGREEGECSIGTQWCANGSWEACQGARMPASEVCDGLDNDCDGQTDENLEKSCGSSIGECKQGVQRCEDGSWSLCDGMVGEKEEECDEKDNDCDGTVDEGCKCDAGDTVECGVDIGECEKGVQECENGQWGDCHWGREPDEEICDEKDNDCDGEIDEGYVCEEEEVKKQREVEDETTEEFTFFEDNLTYILLGIVAVGSVGGFGTLYYLYKKQRKGRKPPRSGKSQHFKDSKDETAYTRRSPLE
jgi:hypothetical protein